QFQKQSIYAVTMPGTDQVFIWNSYVEEDLRASLQDYLSLSRRYLKIRKGLLLNEDDESDPLKRLLSNTEARGVFELVGPRVETASDQDILMALRADRNQVLKEH